MDVKLRPKGEVLRMFGLTVRAYRLQAELTQEKLAERAGVDRTYVGGVERGERNVGLLNLVRLADALEISPAQLLERFTEERGLVASDQQEGRDS
jgi:transcriptional regulator with XRE-family HTH domain